MKLRYWLAVVLTFTFSSALMAAQAPAGSTGQCRDGSYTTAAKKAGACSDHKGVQIWFATSGTGQSASSPSQTAAPATQPAPAPATSPARSSAVSPEPTSSTTPAATNSAGTSTASRAQAPGGGPGMVWVNTSTKVYHCPGKEYYGTTKNGKYMSESDAIAMGARADHNKPCSK